MTNQRDYRIEILLYLYPTRFRILRECFFGPIEGQFLLFLLPTHKDFLISMKRVLVWGLCLNHLNNLPNHSLFIVSLINFSQLGGNICYRTIYVRFAEVGIKPNFQPSLTVKSYQFFRRLEISPKSIKLLESFQGIEKDIQEILLLDVFDLIESDWYVLKVNIGNFATSTQMSVLEIDESGIDYMFIFEPFAKQKQVIFALLIGLEVQTILLYFFEGESIEIKFAFSVLNWPISGKRVLNFFPVLFRH